MSLSLPRLDLTQIFCDVDDFYREFERFCERNIPRLPFDSQPKRYQSKLSISDLSPQTGQGSQDVQGACGMGQILGRLVLRLQVAPHHQSSRRTARRRPDTW